LTKTCDILTNSYKQPKKSDEVLPFTDLSTTNSKDKGRITDLIT
jgi:hypothetical protein